MSKKIPNDERTYVELTEKEMQIFEKLCISKYGSKRLRENYEEIIKDRTAEGIDATFIYERLLNSYL